MDFTSSWIRYDHPPHWIETFTINEDKPRKESIFHSHEESETTISLLRLRERGREKSNHTAYMHPCLFFFFVSSRNSPPPLPKNRKNLRLSIVSWNSARLVKKLFIRFLFGLSSWFRIITWKDMRSWENSRHNKIETKVFCGVDIKNPRSWTPLTDLRVAPFSFLPLQRRRFSSGIYPWIHIQQCVWYLYVCGGSFHLHTALPIDELFIGFERERERATDIGAAGIRKTSTHGRHGRLDDLKRHNKRREK